MKSFWTPLALSLLLLITCCTTSLAQTNVIIPERQARIIATSLKKYEALKPITVKLRVVKDSLLSVNSELHQVIVLQDTTIHQLHQVISAKELLFQDQTVKRTIYQKKAAKRGVTNIILSGVVVFLTYLVIR